jgi:flagellin-like protein
MKGISTVIATLMMLVITIALAGMAYMYISGVFTAQTQGIEIVDSWCSDGIVNVRIRNIGTAAISADAISVTQTAPAGDSANPDTCCRSAIDAGQIQTYTDSCSGTGARNCVYRFVPPAGRAIQVVVSCT